MYRRIFGFLRKLFVPLVFFLQGEAGRPGINGFDGPPGRLGGPGPKGIKGLPAVIDNSIEILPGDDVSVTDICTGINQFTVYTRIKIKSNIKHFVGLWSGSD